MADRNRGASRFFGERRSSRTSHAAVCGRPYLRLWSGRGKPRARGNGVYLAHTSPASGAPDPDLRQNCRRVWPRDGRGLGAEKAFPQHQHRGSGECTARRTAAPSLQPSWPRRRRRPLRGDAEGRPACYRRRTSLPRSPPEYFTSPSDRQGDLRRTLGGRAGGGQAPAGRRYRTHVSRGQDRARSCGLTRRRRSLGSLVLECRPLRTPHTRARGRPRRGQRCDLTFGPAQPPDPPAPPQARPRVARCHAPGARPCPAQRRRQGRVRTSHPCRTGSRRRRGHRGDASADREQRDGVTSNVWRRRSPLVFLFVTVFVDMIGYGIVVPLLPFYAGPYASGAVLVGLLGSLYAAMQFVGGPFLGGLSDRHGRRPVLLLCLLGTSIAYLLLGLAQTLASLVLAVVLAGAASGTLATAQAYIADSTAKEDRARGLGLIGAAFGLGLMAGPALGGLLSLHSLSAPALFASALALTNFAFGYLTLPESLASHLRKRVPLVRLDPISQLAHIMKMSNVRVLLTAVLLLNLALAGLVNNFSLFSHIRFGWGTTSNALFFAFVGMCAVVTQGFLIGRLQPRFGESRLLVGGLALVSLNLLLVGLVSSSILLYPIVGLLALGMGLAIPSLTALISNRTPAEAQGRLMGGMQAILSLAMILGPAFAGLAFDYVGIPAPYLIGGTLSVLALIVSGTDLLPGRRTRVVQRA